LSRDEPLKIAQIAANSPPKFPKLRGRVGAIFDVLVDELAHAPEHRPCRRAGA
jgi:hypothetical protein